MKKLKVSAVSYLNTKPFLYGLENSELFQDIDLELHIPSEGADCLREGRADIGLIPVAVLPELSGYRVITDTCIGAEGDVETVVLFAKKPLDQIDTVLLDFHSRTSAQLVQVLFREYWRQEVRFEAAEKGYEARIEGNTAGLVIGDRVFEWRSRFEYQYDLAGAWFDCYQLPFTFAVWVATEHVSEDQIARFSNALSYGIDNIPAVAAIWQDSSRSNFDLEAYLKDKISYNFDRAKRTALKKFLSLIKENTLRNPSNNKKLSYAERAETKR